MTREIRFPPAPPFTVLLDPDDDAAIMRAAPAAHHLRSGRITVHPTPGARSATLAFDILAALGKPPVLPGSWAGAGPPAWNIAGAWILTLPVTRLLLLRAHLLDAEGWQDLLTLRRRTGLHLVAVCHQSAMPAVMRAALREVEHTCIPVHDPRAAEVLTPAPPTPPPNVRIDEGRWITLPSLAYLDYFPQADFPSCRCTPRHTGHRTGRHRLALPEPSAYALAQITHRLATRTAHPQLTAALATAVFTAAPADQLASVHVGHLSADAATLALHDPQGARPTPIGYGCTTYPVPPWARPFLKAAANVLLLSPPGAGEARLLAGLPRTRLSLTEFAEHCRMRPPQPAKPRPRRRSKRRAASPPRVRWFDGLVPDAYEYAAYERWLNPERQ
ncbi:hypothetical protein [Streptomyces sp. NPDC051776]|uniref:hypothetical protein n=1 Tax=Streptomyces sp. NPDC051776 TaxID=3155414 RepID=UPI003445A628